MIALRDLRLANARALLEHDVPGSFPELDGSHTRFLQKVIDQLCELSLKDPLTGLANRRHFHNALRREIDAVARSGDAALLLMLDIDHFKKVNDTYGHLAGDQVLQSVAKTLGACVRPMDTVTRYGGEEFAAILPNCPASFGKVVAERIRQSVEALTISVAPAVTIQVSISIGGAYATERVRSTTAVWIDRADSQLYRAKTEGRNRVFIDQQPEIAVSAEEKNMLFYERSIDDPACLDNGSSDAAVVAADSAMDRLN